MAADLATASAAVMEPSVQTSNVSLSKSISLPTRTSLTSYLARRIGEKMESIGIQPITSVSFLFFVEGT